MKIFIITIAFACVTNIECGTIKKLVETAANEMNKIAGKVENAVSKATLSNANIPMVTINSNTSNNTENISRSVFSDVSISDSNNGKMQAADDKTPVQVKVEINVVVNYQTGNADNLKTSEDKKAEGSSLDVIKFPTSGSNAEAAKDVSNINKQTENIQFSGDITTVSPFGVPTVSENSNVVFPGPMSTVTRDDKGYFVETVKETKSQSNIIFSDSKDTHIMPINDKDETKRNVNDRGSINKPRVDVLNKPTSLTCPNGLVMTENGICLPPTNDSENNRKNTENFTVNKPKDVTSGCGEGMVMSAKGYCLMPVDGPENKRNSIESATVHTSKEPTEPKEELEAKAVFDGDCLPGYGRTLNGSCEKIEDY